MCAVRSKTTFLANERWHHTLARNNQSRFPRLLLIWVLIVHNDPTAPTTYGHLQSCMSVPWDLHELDKADNDRPLQHITHIRNKPGF